MSTAPSTTKYVATVFFHLTSQTLNLVADLRPIVSLCLCQIGACRHGDRCSRKHQRPVHSQTILLSNVYQNPGMDPHCKMTEKELQDDFDMFYEDMYT